MKIQIASGGNWIKEFNLFYRQVLAIIEQNRANNNTLFFIRRYTVLSKDLKCCEEI